MRNQRIIQFVVSIFAVGGLLAPASVAQQRAGSSGRALDANQRSGSGSVNSLEGQVDYSARNSIITGNVPGLRSFQGAVPYTAPNEFRGRLGTDDLFRFRRQSLGSGPLSVNRPDIYNGTGGGATNSPPSIYRNFSSPALYNAGSTNLGDQARLNSNADLNSLNAPQRVGGTGSLGDIIERQAQTADQYGASSTAGSVNANLVGTGGALQATPLLGVRRSGQPDRGSTPGGVDQGENSTGQTNGDANNPAVNEDRGFRPGEADLTRQQANLNESFRLRAAALGPNQGQNASDNSPSALAQRGLISRGGLLLGRQLQGAQNGADRGQVDRRFSALNQSLSNQLRVQARQSGSGVYQSLVQSLNQNEQSQTPGQANQQARAGQGGAHGQFLPDQWGSTKNNQGSANSSNQSNQSSGAEGRPGQDRQTSGNTNQANAQQNALSRGLSEPSNQQVAQAERQASQALQGLTNQSNPSGQTPLGQSNGTQSGGTPSNSAQSNGLSNSNATANENSSEGQQSVDLSKSINSQLPASARKLLNQLDTTLPRVETLSGDSDSRGARTMHQAEKKLASRKFFDAEALYRQAHNNNPKNPMARVGLVHSQMAAGLIRSAAFNLRQLFEKHPELINVRYEKKLLPPSDRLKWLQTELNHMVQAGQGGASPGLMLAYLGHQVQSKQLVRYGLATAQSVAPEDPLLATVRRIWLNPAKSAPNSAKTKPSSGEDKPADSSNDTSSPTSPRPRK